MTIAEEFNKKLKEEIKEDTHAATHDLLTKHNWELSSVNKTAPLVSTHIYRHNQYPNHEFHVTNFSGTATHLHKDKNAEGYHQEIRTVVPTQKVKIYLDEFHKNEDKKGNKK